MTLNFELDRLMSELEERKPKKILVQLPEGIKQNVFEISRQIEKAGIEVIFSGETCWGGCSVAVQEAEALGADLIVHFGHAPFTETNFPVLYVEVMDELELKPMLEKSLESLKNFKNLGLSYSIQHRHDLEEIKNFYEDKGKSVLLSKKMGHAAYEGHVVGCEYSGLKAIRDEVDVFVIIGNRFHSMGAVLAVEKPVILIDVYNDEVKSMENLKEKILKQRFLSIEKFREAENVGIIIEIKPGQKFGSPSYLLKKLKESGKNAVVITMDELTPDKIMNFYDVQAFVELACPRIALDDFEKYPKPMITFREALVALGEKSWEDTLKSGVV